MSLIIYELVLNNHVGTKQRGIEMNGIELVILALALSADALAVSISRGMISRGKGMLPTAAAFGAAQGVMPVLGFYFGGLLFPFFLVFRGELFAAIILGVLGLRMILEGRAPQHKSCQQKSTEALGEKRGVLAAQAAATSIDAFAVGVGLSGVCQTIFFPALTIGLVTFWVCLAGFLLGKALGIRCGEKAQVLGGAVLFILACKIALV